MSCRRAASAGLLVVGLLASGCGDGRAQSSRPAMAEGAGALPEVLATIGGAPVTLEEVRQVLGTDLDKLETEYLRNRQSLVQAGLERVLDQRVLAAEAARRGTSIEAMVVEEAGGTLDPTPVEVAAWYDANRARLQGRTLEVLEPQIAQFLREQRREEAVSRLRARLWESAGVEVRLQPFRLALDNGASPSRGPADAPVTVVEFSDFQCPYCGRFYPTLKQVEAAYAGRIRVVYRQFPLTNLHAEAFKAAEASLCAHAQGQFWAMHDLMFEDQGSLDVPSLKAKASHLGLDRKAFDACLDGGRYADQVRTDLDEGNRAGVGGTPALFVNGVPVDGGAVPFEVLAAAIDAELARAGR